MKKTVKTRLQYKPNVKEKVSPAQGTWEKSGKSLRLYSYKILEEDKEIWPIVDNKVNRHLNTVNQ